MRNRSRTHSGWSAPRLGVAAVALIFGTATNALAQTGTATWQSFPLTAVETGGLTVEFDATPDTATVDGVVGLADGSAAGNTELAAIIRFANTGIIDARDGGAYVAENVVPYSAGTQYHVRMVIRVPTRIYSVYVTPAGGSEQTIG